MNNYIPEEVVNYINDKSDAKLIVDDIRIKNNRIYVTEKNLVFLNSVIDEFKLFIYEVNNLFGISDCDINGKFVFPKTVRKLSINNSTFSNTELNLSNMRCRTNEFNKINNTNLTKIVMPHYTPFTLNFLPAFEIEDNAELCSMVFQREDIPKAMAKIKGRCAFTKFNDIQYEHLNVLSLSEAESFITNFDDCDKCGNVNDLYLNMDKFKSFEGIKNLKVLM